MPLCHPVANSTRPARSTRTPRIEARVARRMAGPTMFAVTAVSLGDLGVGARGADRGAPPRRPSPREPRSRRPRSSVKVEAASGVEGRDGCSPRCPCAPGAGSSTTTPASGVEDLERGARRDRDREGGADRGVGAGVVDGEGVAGRAAGVDLALGAGRRVTPRSTTLGGHRAARAGGVDAGDLREEEPGDRPGVAVGGPEHLGRLAGGARRPPAHVDRGPGPRRGTPARRRHRRPGRVARRDRRWGSPAARRPTLARPARSRVSPPKPPFGA